MGVGGGYWVYVEFGYRDRINSGLGRLCRVWMVQYGHPCGYTNRHSFTFSDYATLTHGPNSPYSAINAVISIGSFHSVSHLIDHFNHL